MKVLNVNWLVVALRNKESDKGALLFLFLPNENIFAHRNCSLALINNIRDKVSIYKKESQLRLKHVYANYKAYTF